MTPSTAAKVAVVGMAAAGLAVGGYFLLKTAARSALTTRVNGSTGPVTVYPGNIVVAASGGTPNGPASTYVCPAQSTASGCSVTPLSFDSNGNLSVSFGDAVVGSTVYVTVLDSTTGVLSNYVAVTVSSSPPASCTSVEVTCYANGAVAACCPSGDLCPDPSTGACPVGSVPDPNHPGCCVQQAASSYAAHWNAPNGGNVSWQLAVCQPTTLYPAGCCGTPVISGATLSFRIQVLDQNNLPMTGVTVLWLIPTLARMPFTLDAQSYVTDATGSIYPNVSWPDPPTECYGNSHSDNGQLQFYVQGQGPGTGAAVATVNFMATASYTEHLGFLGSCGSCP